MSYILYTILKDSGLLTYIYNKVIESAYRRLADRITRNINNRILKQLNRYITNYTISKPNNTISKPNNAIKFDINK